MQTGFNFSIQVVKGLSKCGETNYTLRLGLWPKAGVLGQLYLSATRTKDGHPCRSCNWVLIIPKFSSLWGILKRGKDEDI